VASPPELIRYIRFQLSQLSSLNKHHEFEELTRHFSRLRICENILPATGPVGSGGDQGKDFETYRSYLTSTPIATSTAIGISGDKKIVFACSLEEKKRILTKIKSDSKVICNGPKKINAIYYFCEADVPVAKRHKLQDWCLRKFDVELEVFDGQALAEQLTGLDVFWIAEEYLNVPSDMYPQIAKEPTIYSEYKQHWLIEKSEPKSYYDFFQIKYGIRRATFNVDAKSDLNSWIKKIEVFLKNGFPITLKRRAQYEICVASLRGLNNLTAKKDIVEDYFSKIDSLQSPSDLKDATILLSYCSSAHIKQHFQIEAEKLHKWTVHLIKQIEEAINKALGPNTLCSLFETRGQAGHLQYQKGTAPYIDIDGTFKWWERLIKEVNKAPLFPLDDFADLLNVLIEIYGEDPRFLKLTRRVDDLLTKRSGGYIAAQKCKDRAVKYYDLKKYLLAIKQLHQAKIKWFSAETIYGSLLAMLTLSECYQRLGLAYAAKYYSAGAAYIAFYHNDDDIKSLLPQSLFSLSDCHYLAGEWLSFTHIVHLALNTHNMYDDEPLDINKHEELQRTFAHTAIIRTLTQRFNRDLANEIDKTIEEWPIYSDLRDDIKNLAEDETNYWKSASIDIIWKSAQEQLSGRPFCDVGVKRAIRWKALGIDWNVNFQNEYLVTSISEEFVSILQIIQADIAHEDFCLLPTKVMIECYITEGERISIKEKPDNIIASWVMNFPKGKIQEYQYFTEFRKEIIALTTVILSKCTTLDSQTFLQKIHAFFSRDLPLKVLSVRPYAELFVQFISQDAFESSNKKALTPLEVSRDFLTIEHDELRWIDKLGPRYSREKSRKFIANRYTNGIRPIRLTLQRLLKEEKIRIIIRKLKNEGYLDWQILMIFVNIVINYRTNRLLAPGASLESQREKMLDIAYKEEKEDDVAIPLDIFNEDMIKIQKNIFLVTVAKTWGLVIYRITPDFIALKKYLDMRYNNSKDDVEHEDIFTGI
jgi:hypothetical protein